jgi:hypothetical protein
MRKMIFLLLILPFAGLAQTKTVVNTSRYFPKSGKWQAFEKAVSAHAKKYHKNDFAWRVFTIETGPDAGGYMIVEGVSNWTNIDGRGDLGAAHTADWEANVQPLLQDKFSTMYLTFRADLSTVELTAYSDKISINHVFVRPGFRGEVLDNITTSKKLWEADGAKMAVYESSISGEPQFSIVTRYANGLKQRDEVNATPFDQRFEKANGAGSWKKYLDNIKAGVSSQWSELLYAKKELGSN